MHSASPRSVRRQVAWAFPSCSYKVRYRADGRSGGSTSWIRKAWEAGRRTGRRLSPRSRPVRTLGATGNDPGRKGNGPRRRRRAGCPPVTRRAASVPVGPFLLRRPPKPSRGRPQCVALVSAADTAHLRCTSAAAGRPESSACAAVPSFPAPATTRPARAVGVAAGRSQHRYSRCREWCAETSSGAVVEHPGRARPACSTLWMPLLAVGRTFGVGRRCGVVPRTLEESRRQSSNQTRRSCALLRPGGARHAGSTPSRGRGRTRNRGVRGCPQRRVSRACRPADSSFRPHGTVIPAGASSSGRRTSGRAVVVGVEHGSGRAVAVGVGARRDRRLFRWLGMRRAPSGDRSAAPSSARAGDVTAAGEPGVRQRQQTRPRPVAAAAAAALGVIPSAPQPRRRRSQARGVRGARGGGRGADGAASRR